MRYAVVYRTVSSTLSVCLTVIKWHRLDDVAGKLHARPRSRFRPLSTLENFSTSTRGCSQGGRTGGRRQLAAPLDVDRVLLCP